MSGPRQLVLGTAGHIDHGKTALVRALTGVETDRLPAEKKRGITIDLGFAPLDLGGRTLALVDVPGHERFIRNMLAGATGLDLALLVVAADDSVMPQTREHLEILRLLGLSGGLVALTKCDLADPTWLDLVEEDVKALVAGTFLEGAPIVRTSATAGFGIDRLKAALLDLADRAPDRDDPGPFRLAIDRAFTVAGHGTVVTGTIASGRVSVGDDLQWLPDGRGVRVRGLRQHDRPVETLDRGARAAINLNGVHHTEIRRGQEIATPGYLFPSRVLSVEIRPAEGAPRPLKHRGRYRVHLGTAEAPATLSLLEIGDEGRPSIVQLLLAGPVVAVHGEPFVLRDESPPATVGGGLVLAPNARRLRRRDAASIRRLDLLRSPDPEARASAWLADRGLAPWSPIDLVREAGIPTGRVGPVLEALSGRKTLIDVPLGPRRSARLPADVAAGLEDRVVRAMARLHAARPRQSAIRRAHVLAALPDLADEPLIAAILGRLIASGRVLGDSKTVALKEFEPKLSHGERRLKADLADQIQVGGLAPPDLADLASKAGSRAPVVPELLALLADEGRIIEVGPGLYLDTDVEARIREAIRGRLADGASITMAQIRDLLGTTRKFAVPIGEHLDRIGLTRRQGDLRILAAPESSVAP